MLFIQNEEGRNRQGRTVPWHLFSPAWWHVHPATGPLTHTFLSGGLVMCPAYGWS